MSWNPVPDASGYRIVRGDLILLRQTGGDFAQSATTCVGDDWPDPGISYPWEPLPGEADWILVSAQNCAGHGSYDSGGLGQQGSRDAGVDASGVCP